MEHILLETPYLENKHVALIRLDRPKVLNAISTDLLREVVLTLRELDREENIRVIIITGSDKAFAAGADLKKMVDSNPIEQLGDERANLWQEFRQIKKPIIAAVNGYALGGGCELAMSCDFIMAGEDAKFGQPEINVGITPGAGGTQRLTHALGKAKAMHLVLTGEMFSARQAERFGLVTKVVPSKALMQETLEIAKKIAAKSPLATRLAKEAINKSFEMSLSDGLDFERRNFYLNFAGADQKEGMNAFLEKRTPEYKGY